MSFRKEKKIRLTIYEFGILRNKLLLQGMKPLFEKREINSLYYDTDDYGMYHDSEEGLLPRKKVRIRWYDDITKASKEVKISSFEGRFKTSDAFHVPSRRYLPKSFYDSYYGSISPSLCVSYIREYFLYKEMRITFDSYIKYVNERFSHKIPVLDGECVMEVKVGFDVPDDYIERVIEYPISRFSKYSRGLLTTGCEL